VLRKFWGIVPITAQDAKTIYEADKDSLLYPTDGDEVVLHKGHMGMGGVGASVISGGSTGVGARYKENNIRRRPDFLFCCFIEVTMTVVKSVSDGLRETEILRLN
jgi:hypothetical protein